MQEPEPAREEQKEAPISERDRTLTNVLLLVIVGALVGGGIWIANTMLDVRKVQDCVASGRRNCAPISVPGRDSFDVPASSRQ